MMSVSKIDIIMQVYLSYNLKEYVEQQAKASGHVSTHQSF